MARGKAPNLFELRGSGTKITWTPAGVDGSPRLTYDAGDGQASFGREELRVFKSVMGRLVTAALEVVPDAYTVTLSLVVPAVSLGDQQDLQVKTIAVVTTEQSPFGGPGLFNGQVQNYKVLRLSGRARLVEF